ncbi:MAG TPA: glutamate--tRNA ligase [Terriglobia bacterium]|nr:glutamate--tRNA ligase [Terriglobia bacterium]
MSEVRVRFAPSPTGYLHVGNARTALFNWLFARHKQGAFVLRIEDTDVERSKTEHEAQLLEDLRWFGLDWDEGPDRPGPFGPYRQSERKELYAQHATHLIDAGHAYFCFCTAEQLEAERQEAVKAGRQPMYSGRCRQRPREESARKVAEGQPASIRLKIEGGSFAWNDLVHGLTTFSSDVIGDFILVRSDGNPAYNYAVVIDDRLMEISHVIRGDDHISNTPRQLALYQAFGWEPPQFAHLSTILGPDRARLSKRHGATSLQNFRDMGILPEALGNYLALLGWSPHDGVTEILTVADLVAQFSLDRITKSPAVFDQEKLNWMNRHYLKESPLRRLAQMAVPFLAGVGYLPIEAGASDPSGLRGGATEPLLQWLERIVDAVLKNLDRLDQLPEAARLIFEYDARRTADEVMTPDDRAASADVLAAFIPPVLAEPGLTYTRFREIAKGVQKQTGKKGRELFHPIRVAVTGAVSGPELEKLIPIFEEGAKLSLAPPIKSTARRLREFAEAAKLF